MLTTGTVRAARCGRGTLAFAALIACVAVGFSPHAEAQTHGVTISPRRTWTAVTVNAALHFTLRQAQAAGMRCGTSTCALYDQLTLRHPKFGRGNLIWISQQEVSLLGFIDAKRRLRWAISAIGTLPQARLSSDGTGNVFLITTNGGPNQSVIVLRPTLRGFSDLGTLGSNAISAFGIRLVDEEADGINEIALFDRDCTGPDACNDDEVLARTLRWNGRNYQ